MRDGVRRDAARNRIAIHLRNLVVASAMALLPSGLAIADSTAATTTTSTRVLARQAVPDSICLKLTKRADCYIATSLTQTTVARAAWTEVFVRQASAWTGCSGIYNYAQTFYSGSISLAQGSMQFAYCYDNSGVQVTWGPYCYVKTLPGYGGGNNYCSGNGYPTFPGFARDSWYLFAWAWPWWHVNNLQQVLIYPTWQSWSGCLNC